MILLKKKPRDYTGLQVDWIFGDNFLQRYCVLLEYAVIDSRIGFAFSISTPVVSMSIIIILLCSALFLFNFK